MPGAQRVSRRSLRPNGGGLVKRHAKASVLHFWNTAEPLRGFKQGEGCRREICSLDGTSSGCSVQGEGVPG